MFLDELYECVDKQRTHRADHITRCFHSELPPMVFPRLEAEDFRAIALAPYAPLGATFLVAVPMGWLSRLRGLVVKAAQTWPAGNEVSYRVSNEWMLAPGHTMLLQR